MTKQSVAQDANNGKAVRIELLQENYTKLDAKLDTVIKLVTELDKRIDVANARRGETCPVREDVLYDVQEEKRARVEDIRGIYTELGNKVDRKDVTTTWGTLTKIGRLVATLAPWGLTLALAMGWIGR